MSRIADAAGMAGRVRRARSMMTMNRARFQFNWNDKKR
ncbi:hypothetical protein BURCENBC7_AP5602 [Burkholderia cenocepacia BC7]|nr:hypothetical protein BURCENK562V_C5794 [Burkholderia cenocepacia K56-2Valvano]ERI28029.1 hypothetical protein BURCENBC7_AP5602 [Burkholderia cenocepacia BC7]